MTDHAWQVGQRVALDGRRIVKIDRVTPTGIALVETRSFRPDGRERGDASSRIEPITADLETKIALLRRKNRPVRALYAAIDRANQRAKEILSDRRNPAPAPEIERAERLTEAIKEILDGECA